MDCVYCIMSRIERMFSPIHLPGMYPDWLSCISSSSSRFILSELTFEAILASTFKSEIGLQFFRSQRSWSFFFNKCDYSLCLWWTHFTLGKWFIKAFHWNVSNGIPKHFVKLNWYLSFPGTLFKGWNLSTLLQTNFPFSALSLFISKSRYRQFLVFKG